MDPSPDADPPPLAAGAFSAWLAGMRRTLDSDADADVPCGGCTACCTSSQFVHIGPDEVDALRRIPAELLFPAPLRLRGHVVLGYDQNGHCPMLVEGGCSIYEHRPRTCRTYDCRVFAAAGVEIDDADQIEIGRRAGRWRFDHPDEVDRTRHDAVRAAARYVRERADLLPAGTGPVNTTGRAVLAVRLHDAFLGHDDETDRRVVVEPDPEAIRVVIGRRLGP